MRHRLGGVHCQTYEELFDILDTNTNNHSLSLDIHALLEQQQTNSIPIQHTQNYFFDEQRQIQAEEDQLQLQIQAERQKNGLTTKSVVLICKDLCQIKQKLLSKQFIEAAYNEMYGGQIGERDEIEAEVVGSIVNVNLKASNLSQVYLINPANLQLSSPVGEQSVSECEKSVLSEKGEDNFLEYLQLVIYYNKIRQNNTTQQHKIWLIRQQPQYSPIYQVYLTKASHIYRTTLTPNKPPDLKLIQTTIKQLEDQATIKDQMNQNSKTSRRWREVLNELQNNGLCAIGSKKR